MMEVMIDYDDDVFCIIILRIREREAQIQMRENSPKMKTTTCVAAPSPQNLEYNAKPIFSENKSISDYH